MISEHERLQAHLKAIATPPKAAPTWSQRHTEIVEKLIGRLRLRLRDPEIARQIEVETGDRFKPRTVAEHRRQLGYRAAGP